MRRSGEDDVFTRLSIVLFVLALVMLALIALTSAIGHLIT